VRARMPEDEWIWLALAWRALAARFGALGAAQRLQRAWMLGNLRLRGARRSIPKTDEVIEIPASEAGRLSLDCPQSRIVRISSQGRRRLWEYQNVQARKADVDRLAPEATTPISQPPRAARTADTIRHDDTAQINTGVGTSSGGDDGPGDLTGDVAAAPARQEEAAPASVNTPVNAAPAKQPPQSVAIVAETRTPEPGAPTAQETGTTVSERKRADELGTQMMAVVAAIFKEWSVRPRGMKVDDMLRRLLDVERHPDLGTFGKSTFERAIREAKLRGWSG
jgi:hypothetical protein